jgi:hypothetical protein
MRWFKHMSRSHMDTGLCRLMDEFGVEGYGAYWLLLEAIADQCDSSNNVTISMSHQNWRKVLPFYPKRLEKFAQCLGNLQLFSVEVSDSLVTISCPKLLKYRDEYAARKAKKSGQVPEKDRLDIDIDTDTDKYRRIGQTASPAAVLSGFTIFHQDGEMKISQRDFDAWQKAYPHIDLAAELQALSDWTRSTKEWTKKSAFHACSAALKIKNEKARTYAAEKKRQEDSPPPPQRFN